MTNTVNIQLPGITSTAQIKLYNTIGSMVLQHTTQDRANKKPVVE